MARKKVYRFLNHCQGTKKSRERRFSGHSLCPGNGARSALRSLLSVALSSARAPRFYHAVTFLPLAGFSL
jgi:hypothetical protein